MMPKEKEKTINNIIGDLKQIDNALPSCWGFYATGKATDTSDIDLGIYYSEKDLVILIKERAILLPGYL